MQRPFFALCAITLLLAACNASSGGAAGGVGGSASPGAGGNGGPRGDVSTTGSPDPGYMGDTRTITYPPQDPADKLKVEITREGEELVVRTYDTTDAQPAISYVFKRDGAYTDPYTLHIESDAPGEHFAIHVAVLRFYRGTYTLRVSVQGSDAVLATRTLNVE